MGKGYSVSATQGDIAPEHDRREYTPDNVDGRLTKYDFVIIDTPDERRAFNDLFADSIDAVNAKTKRNDRKKSYDYISEIEADDRKEKPFYEYVFQIGNRDTNGVTTSDFDHKAWEKDKNAYDIRSCMNKDPDRLKLKAILDSEMQCLQERYPAFHFWSIIGHDDEPNGTYHYHVRFTPVGNGYAKGMQKRCSLTKALGNMGFVSDNADYGITQWQNDVKDRIAEAMEKEGYHREFMSNEEKHASVSLYKAKQEKEKLFKECEEKVADTKKQVKEELEKLSAAKQEAVLDAVIEARADMDVELMLAEQELWEGIAYEKAVAEHNLALERRNLALERSKIENRDKESLERQKRTLEGEKRLERQNNELKKGFEANRRITDYLPKFDVLIAEREKKGQKVHESIKTAVKNAHKDVDQVRIALATADDCEERKQCEAETNQAYTSQV